MTIVRWNIKPGAHRIVRNATRLAPGDAAALGCCATARLDM
jgi:hypothetical protein